MNEVGLELPSYVRYLDVQDAPVRPVRHHARYWPPRESRERVAYFGVLPFASATDHGARNLEGAPKVEKDSISGDLRCGENLAEAGVEEGDGPLSVRDDRR